MKKTHRIWLTAALLLMLSLAMVPVSAFAASGVSGSTGSTTTFYVNAINGNSYIKLYAGKGTAYVADYEPGGGSKRFDGYDTEKHYGFFYVRISGSGYSRTYRWVPSESFSLNLGDFNDEIRDSRTLEIPFPGSGEYQVTVEPMSANEISGYWYYDEFEYWISDATWKVDAAKNCAAYYGYGSARYNVMCYDEYGSLIRSATETVSSSVTVNPPAISGYTTISSSQYVSFDHNTGTCSPSTVSFYYRKNAPSSATLYIYCYDEYGSSLGTYTESINSSRTINPPSINGYTANSSGRSVTFNSGTGTCSPSDISFYYQKKSQPAPQPQPQHGTVYPSSWDTQFRPCSCRQDNEDKYRDLPKLYDDNANTAFWWVIWKSEREDSIPELTAYFSNDTVSTIGIRNGWLSKYTQYARVARFRVNIYHSGGVSTTYVYVPDIMSYDYQTFSLGGTYSGVSRIELYLDGGDGEGFYKGSYEKYYLYITDIRFGN